MTVLQVLDCFSTASVLVLSWIFLKVWYKCLHYSGVAICLAGIACLVTADYYGSRNYGAGMCVTDNFFINNISTFARLRVQRAHLENLHCLQCILKKSMNCTSWSDKIHTEYWKLAETVGQRNKWLEKLKQPHVDLQLNFSELLTICSLIYKCTWSYFSSFLFKIHG